MAREPGRAGSQNAIGAASEPPRPPGLEPKSESGTPGPPARQRRRVSGGGSAPLRGLGPAEWARRPGGTTARRSEHDSDDGQP